MNTTSDLPCPILWKLPGQAYFKLAILAALVVFLFYDSWSRVMVNWYTTEEYSHGFFIPVITLFLIWQNKNEIANLEFHGSVAGLLLLLLGLLLYLTGQLSALDIIVQYSLVVVLMGVPLALAGWRIFKHMWVPLLFLSFAIPLPEFLLKGLSAQLQLISSQLGVYFIRLLGVSVYLEGNVIDLGSYQLQVAEACSGLNYLFPLMSVAFMCAYFFQAPLWQRAIIFLSSMPITIVMNSLRIGMIGVLTDRFGKSMAEGFLHDFEGWFVFMACTGILLGEMWVLVRIGKEPRPLMEVFGLTLPEPFPAHAVFRERSLAGHYWAVAGLLLLTVGIAQSIEKREETVPARAGFDEFPLQLGEWQGKRQTLDKMYLDALKLDDHFIGDFVRAGEAPAVNFYSAYYASQRKGASIHSPRSCMPGGGWLIDSLDTVALDLGAGHAQPLRVNRALVKKGEDRQLVYYWFQQRGRNLTNEYLVKWYLLWDAIAMNRTDGALVRLTTVVPRTENIQAADRRLGDFLRVAQPQLKRFVPD
jgi:exosortase D (VPLPA-CTERM-specific)